jgi:hypothetical protein
MQFFLSSLDMDRSKRVYFRKGPVHAGFFSLAYRDDIVRLHRDVFTLMMSSVAVRVCPDVLPSYRLAD